MRDVPSVEITAFAVRLTMDLLDVQTEADGTEPLSLEERVLAGTVAELASTLTMVVLRERGAVL